MTRPTNPLATLLAALALVVVAGLSACSGAVGGPPTVNDPARITILPAGTTAAPVTAYSGLPTTFTISGGTGAYIVSSDNQAIVPISGPINGTQFTIVPNPVLASTTVTITVRDTGTAPTASSTITVQPGTVANSITITQAQPQPAGCTAPLICSGSDALVSATLSQGGIPLAARGVRFDVLAGSFSFVTTDPVSGLDTLATTVTVNTDETGKVVARIRVPPNAPNQTALLQITDLGTGTYQRASFIIAQSTGSSPGFVVVPDTIVFQGTLTSQCAGTDVKAAVYVYGGVPPYSASTTSSGFTVFPNSVAASGGSFTVTPNGTCVGSQTGTTVTGAPIIVADSSGHTATTTAANIAGATVVQALTAAPTTISLNSCTTAATFTIAGGISNHYFVSTGSDALTVTVSGNTATVTRRNPSPAQVPDLTATPPGASVSVGVSDGQTATSVTVILVDPGGDGTCP